MWERTIAQVYNISCQLYTEYVRSKTSEREHGIENIIGSSGEKI